MPQVYKTFRDMAESGKLDPDDNEEIKGGPGKKSRKLAKFWLDQVDQVSQLNRNWYERGDNILKRFRDERSQVGALDRKLNVLWSNIKVLMPALYAKPPIPYVERKFLQRDPVGRTSSIILERSTKNELENNGLHTSIKRAVLDYLLPGRGAVWVRYEPEIGEGDSIPPKAEGSFEDDLEEIEPGSDESEESEKLETTNEQIISEQIPVDYIHWKDLFLFPATARTWDEVQAVGKRLSMSKEECRERFGEEITKNLQYTKIVADKNKSTSFNDSAVFKDKSDKSVEVFEIWDKIDRKVVWVSTGYDYLCDIREDPLKLKNFFPIPEIISATLTNETMVPVPDYIEYQDQAIQIDELTKRLAMLTKACKVAGCYDGSNGALKRLFQEGFENDLIPVDAWAAFADKGGVQGGIALLPIDQIEKVIQTLTTVRQNLMMDLDLVTGISDILRGTTDSRETLGGIRLKNNNAGTRLSDRQTEIANFVRNTVAIVAEIAAKHYSVQKLIESSGIMYDDDMHPQNILEELQDEYQSSQPQQPQSQPQLNTPGVVPTAPQSSNMLSNLNMGQPPQLSQPPQSLQNNIIPFPGGSQNNNQPMFGGPAGGNIPPQIGQMNPMGMQMPMAPQPNIMIAIETIAQRISKAIELLRNDVPRGYRIDIETDSTIFGDAAQEREDAVTFIKEVTGFLQGSAQLGSELPEAIPVLGRMLQWGVRKFRVGRDLESALDDFIRKVDKKTKENAKNPPPNPEQEKAQAELQKINAETQAQREKHELEIKAQQANDQRDFQKQQAEDQREMQKQQADAANEARINDMKAQIEQRKHDLEIMKMEQEKELMVLEHNLKMAQARMKLSQDAQKHQQTMQQNQQNADLAREQHQQTLEQNDQQATLNKKQHDQKMKEATHKAKEKDKSRKDKTNKNKGAA